MNTIYTTSNPKNPHFNCLEPKKSPNFSECEFYVSLASWNWAFCFSNMVTIPDNAVPNLTLGSCPMSSPACTTLYRLCRIILYDINSYSMARRTRYISYLRSTKLLSTIFGRVFATAILSGTLPPVDISGANLARTRA